IETNIAIKGYRAREGFGLVDSWKVVERDEDERMIAVEVTLPDWVFASIESMQVLTLNSDYFSIRSALDRRIYELARKHCGKQPSWTVS
ncbi:replication initiator protein A, partial [Ventosimonas gracilis]|uniref:replication initiator protein A n=1 Tax=Ventosimonas gracilis TaxID=1680762 RepID=UPI0018729A35